MDVVVKQLQRELEHEKQLRKLAEDKIAQLEKQLAEQQQPSSQQQHRVHQVKRAPSKIINDAKQREVYEACYRDDADRVRALLLQGKNVDVNFKFDAARHEGNFAGLDLWEGGVTCLMIAAMRGKVDTVRMLVAEFQARIDEQDDNGRTALHYAARYNHLPVVQQLLTDSDELLEMRNKSGATALMKAVMYGNYEIVAFLLQKGADASQRDNSGKTALSLAGLYAQEDAKAKTIELLLLQHQK